MSQQQVEVTSMEIKAGTWAKILVLLSAVFTLLAPPASWLAGLVCIAAGFLGNKADRRLLFVSGAIFLAITVMIWLIFGTGSATHVFTGPPTH